MNSQHAPDIYLERSSTRIVDEFHIHNDEVTSPNVRIAPDSATMTLETDVSPGANIRLDSDANVGLSSLDSRSGGGELRLRDHANASGSAIKIDLSSHDRQRPLLVRNDSDEPTTVFTTSRESGGITVKDHPGVRNVRVESDVVLEDEAASGLVEVHDDTGELTGRLAGDEGALVLDPNESGGELLLKTLPSNDPEERDISVHATADANSDYGVSQDNRPLVFLNGPNASVELGREKDPSRTDTEGPNSRGEGADGRLFLNYEDTGDPSANVGTKRLLEAGVGWPEGERMEQSNIRCGELVFRTARGGTEDAGMLTSCGDNGLTIRTGNGTPALRVRGTGDIATAQPIIRDGLPLGPLDIVPNRVEGLPGDVIDVPVNVGNLTTLHVRFGDQSDSGYELTATITDIQDSSLTLQFDTDAAGDTSTQTLSVDGNAQLDGTTVSETSLNDFPAGTYDVHVEYGTVSDSAAMSVKEVTTPWIDPSEVVVEKGDFATFTIGVGAATSVDLLIGDLDDFYGLKATIEDITESSVDLVYDTSSAGDPSTQTLLLGSNATLDQSAIVETDLEGDLPATTYPMEVSTIGGTSTWKLRVDTSING